MSREELVESIMTYQKRYPEESAVCERYVDFVKKHEECFERELEIGHVTGSAWVVDRSGSRTLLTHHRKLDKWLQPGGHADGERDIQKVARKEVVEETGLEEFELACEGIFDIDIHLIPARKSESAHDHFDIRYAFRVTGSENYVVSHESNDLQWVEISRLLEYTQEESMLRMARKWQEFS